MEENKQLTLNDIAEIAKRQVVQQAVVADLENHLKIQSEVLRLIQEEELPNAMAEIGMDTFSLDTGFKITIKEDVYASIPKDNSEPAFSWLRKNNLDGIIKTNVVCDFGKGEDTKAQRLVVEMEKMGYLAQIKSVIHPQTLKAFLRERLENGLEIPMDYFGAVVKRKSIIK